MANLQADTLQVGSSVIGTSVVSGNEQVNGNSTTVGNDTVLGLTTTAQNAMSVVVLLGSCSFGVASVPVPGSGFYQVPVTGTFGQGSFTGSLPSPTLFPGGDLLLTDTLGIYPWMLTGTMSSFGVTVGDNVLTLSSSNGTHLLMPAGGTVGFWSDSKSRLVCALSGSATLKP